MSNLLTYFDCPTRSIQSLMQERWYESALVCELTLQKSLQNLQISSGFGIKMHGELLHTVTPFN